MLMEQGGQRRRSKKESQSSRAEKGINFRTRSHSPLLSGSIANTILCSASALPVLTFGSLTKSNSFESFSMLVTSKSLIPPLHFSQARMSESGKRAAKKASPSEEGDG